MDYGEDAEGASDVDERLRDGDVPLETCMGTAKSKLKFGCPASENHGRRMWGESRVKVVAEREVDGQEEVPVRDKWKYHRSELATESYQR